MVMADPLCEAILKCFGEMVDCPADWPDDWKAESAPLIRRESIIHRLSSARGQRSICVKIMKRVSRGSQDAASLHAALQHYHARSDHEKGCTVPEPYGCVLEHDAVIMEWVKGRTFGEILKKEQFSKKKRHDNIRKVAAWLRWFHEQSQVESGPVTQVRILKSIVRVFEEACDLNEAVAAHDPAIRRFLEVAANTNGAIHETEIDFAVLHGDFKATNLLIADSGAVVGIDFLGTKRGPVSHDICRFLSDLDFYRNLLGRSYASGSGPRINDFEVFISAYGGRTSLIAKPTFIYLYFLTILSALVHQRRKFKGGVKHLIRLSVLRSIAKQLSQELTKPADCAATNRKYQPWLSLSRLSGLRVPSLQGSVDWGVALWESDIISSFI